MPDASLHLPPRPSLDQLQKQAKELKDESGLATLAEAQHALAKKYGFESWATLRQHVESVNPAGLGQFEKLAQELANAYTSGDFTAIREINWRHGTSFGWDRDPAWMQRQLPRWFGSPARSTEMALEDARFLVARQSGFETWKDLVDSVRSGAPRPGSDHGFYRVDLERQTMEVRGPLSEKQWDTVIGVMQERELTGLSAGVTDYALERLSRLDHLTRLNIEGGLLTDDGARHLARLSRLAELNVGGPASRLTDRGLEVLAELKELKKFQMTWAPRITDAGVAHLTFCDQLEDVNLMGTPTGDGAINALTGKPHLRRMACGTQVTDRGLPLFHRFPAFKTWQGEEAKFDLMSFAAEPTHLLLDGPITGTGLATLAGLEGLAGLNFFWHLSAMTPAALKQLAGLPNLAFLGCHGPLATDEGMRYIAKIPRLRMLMAQGTVAGDDGFAALAGSQTVEYIWGRECPNLGSRGFAALAAMPRLKGLAVSCKNVDDASLAALPHFPALTHLMPMDITDHGFRHVGQCERLTHLWCMYCRDTGDIATGHIAGLKLFLYYAGQTRITDASLEVLGRMTSLEKLEFWQTGGITDVGVAHLTRLPHLREIGFDGIPGVSRKMAAAFASGVRVSIS